MGNRCACDCEKQNMILNSRNLYELGEAMEDENLMLSREITSINNKDTLIEFLEKTKDYIRMFKSVHSNNISMEDFNHLKEVVDKCYVNISQNLDYSKLKKELEYLVDIKFTHSIGIVQ